MTLRAKTSLQSETNLHMFKGVQCTRILNLCLLQVGISSEQYRHLSDAQAGLRLRFSHGTKSGFLVAWHRGN